MKQRLLQSAPAQAAAEEKIRTTFWITFRLGEQSTGTQITPEALLADLGTLGLLELFESGAEGSQDNTWRLSLTTELEAEAVLDVFLLTPEGTEISLEHTHVSSRDSTVSYPDTTFLDFFIKISKKIKFAA